jgi:hypothetical protein
MQAHRTQATLRDDGTLVLDQLPFPAGETVEVIILARPAQPKQGGKYPLRGTLVHYDQPFEPVAEDDWEALR